MVAEEGLLSAVSALCDVMRKIRDDGARETRHPPGIMVGSDIGIGRVYAQVEVFLRGLKKAEAISIACGRGLPRGRPDVICRRE